jgi:hypothetical protein
MISHILMPDKTFILPQEPHHFKTQICIIWSLFFIFYRQYFFPDLILPSVTTRKRQETPKQSPLDLYQTSSIPLLPPNKLPTQDVPFEAIAHKSNDSPLRIN